MSAAEVIPRLPELAGRTVIVVGDVVLDRYVVGRATRLSREAPVPVLVHEESFSLPGSAANPARNIQSLGSRTIQATIIGDDASGAELISLLQEAGVETSSIIRLPGRRTSVKQRILARGTLRYPQQIVRVDWLERAPLLTRHLEALAAAIESRAPKSEAILISDYQGGTVGSSVLAACLHAQKQYGLPVCVDAQGDLHQYCGVSCIKCNRDEASQALGRPLETEGDFETATAELMASLSTDLVAITRGEAGMSLRHKDHGYMSFAAPNRSEVFDVVGAGDTVIAIMTLGMAAGWPPRLLATVAQLGAGIVVQRLGNATTSLAELELAASKWLPAATES